MTLIVDRPVVASPHRRLGIALGALRRALQVEQPARRVRWAVAAVLVVSALLHLAVLIASTGAPYDIASYRIQAQSVFAHQNVYLVTQRYPYPPVWIWLVALAQWVATTLHLPFDQVVKIPASLADLGITAVIATLVRERVGWCWYVVVAAALYALNPVALLVSAGHGQFDALVMVCVLLYFYWRERPGVGGLALGVAIALKGFPVLLLPYAVQTAPRGRRLLLLACACAPLVTSMGLYSILFRFTPAMITRIAGFRGSPFFGWYYFLFQIPWVHNGIASNNAVIMLLVLGLLAVSEIWILASAFLIPGRRFASQPAAACAFLFALFFATTTTMNVEYVVWLLPVLVLALPRASVVYSGAALLGMATFYVQGPGAVGALPTWLNWLVPLLGVPFLREAGVAAILICSAYIVMRLLRGGTARPAPQPINDPTENPSSR